MKKILCFVLAAMMMMSLTVAFAAGSRTGSDIPAATVDGDAISIAIIDDTEAVTALKAMTAEEILAQLPDVGDMATINEIVAIQAFGDLENATDVEVAFTLDTPYEAGAEVKVVIVTADGACVLDGVANDEGAVVVTVPAEVVKALATPAAMIVVSK